MGWLVLLAAVATFTLLLEILGWLTRAVGQRLPLPYAFSRCVTPWIRKGVDGTRVVMYHGPSAQLIQVLKRLSAHRTDAKVSLSVIKTRLPKGKTYDASRGWRIPLKRQLYPSIGVPRWRLPSPYRDGEEVARINCGASPGRVKQALTKLICTDATIAQHAVFYAWFEGRAGWMVLGTFEDEG